MLKLDNIAHSERLKPLSFTAEAGQLIGVIGANGAGKSTLLKIMAGLLNDVSGAATWADQDMTRWSAIERRQYLAFIPQQTQFQEPATVADLLRTAQINLRTGAKELAQWRQLSIEQFELEPLLERAVTELSGGEQRRVTLACTHAMNRPLLIADEPTASLDLNYQLLTMDWLKTSSQQGKLVFVALHDLALAAQYCDQILLLHHGALLAHGTPNQVLTDANLATAYKVSVDWLCNPKGVAMLPRRL